MAYSNSVPWNGREGEERPKGIIQFDSGDSDRIKKEAEKIGAKSILEFGPGDSTQALIDMGIFDRIVTCEHIEKWYEAAKERFKPHPHVKVLKFLDEVPCVIEGLEPTDRFDIAFVDTPQGYNPVRKRHPGFEDCSRINTVMAALALARVVLLHDSTRPLERATLGRVWATGLYDIKQLPTKLGMARISHRNENAGRLDPPDATEPGGPSTRAKPKQRRVPVDKRPSGSRGKRSEKAKRGECHNGIDTDNDIGSVLNPDGPYPSSGCE